MTPRSSGNRVIAFPNYDNHSLPRLPNDDAEAPAAHGVKEPTALLG